ncbi:MAG: AraC family transcriptional regulator [Verrucomicrobiota bacterium JB022]|nr:AraC family transcriptional regulator [Verrucomicrobiota bacterium JB022]
MEQLVELRDLISRHCSGPAYKQHLPRLSMYRAEEPTRPTFGMFEPRLCVVAQGCKHVMLGDQIYEYNEANYLIASLDLPVAGCVCVASHEKPYLAMSIALDISTLTALISELPEPEDAPNLSGLSVTPIDADLLEPLIRLMRLLDRPSDIPFLAPLAEREILYRLLTGPQGMHLRQIALGEGRMARISRAIAWIREYYDRPLDIDRLTEVAHMSHSSFFRHFKAATSLSPLQFQKNIRLQEARRLMLGQQGDAANIGFRVGYESPSQFSREYSRMFGAPPARDAARLREALQELETPQAMAM